MNEDEMRAAITGRKIDGVTDEPVLCTLCGAESTLATIDEHLAREHGVYPTTIDEGGTRP